MVTITLRNVPNKLYTQLKQAAKSNNHSINDEIISCLEKAIQNNQLSPDIIIAQARKLREQTTGFLISDNDFTEAKKTGRL